MRKGPIAAVMALALLVVPADITRAGTGTSDISNPTDPATVPAVRGARTQLTPIPGPPMTCAPGSYVHSVDTHGVKLVALTFDDGPGPTETQQVMTELEQYGGRATFFEIAGMATVYPDVSRDVIRRGFEIGNHSVSHTHIGVKLAPEISVAGDMLQQITGVRPRLFRSPGLSMTAIVQNELARQGMCNIFANILSQDTDLPVRNSAQLCQAFKNQLKPGSIVLMHDYHHPYTVNAVPCMAAWAVSQGYQLVTVSTLLGQGYSTR